MLKFLLRDIEAKRRFSIILAVSSSLFIYFFLVIFQPFGVNNYRPHDNFSPELLLGILPVIPVFLISILLLEFYLRPLFSRKFKWNAIAWYLTEFFLLGSISFLLYNYLGNFHDMHLRSYLLHVVEVSSVLVFPFLGTILYYQIRALETRKKTNAQHSGPIKKRLLFKGQYKKDQIRLLEEQILFLTSEDNYVALHYVEQGEHKTHLIRATMGSLLDQVNSELLVRCHRSYVVNISRIKKMRKSASRDVLFLNDYDKMLPVSRGYRDELLQKLEGLQ